MKESDFIEYNHEKWRHYESLLEDNARPGAEEIHQALIQTADDLSYSRTFYANRAIKSYLNGLLQRISAKIFVPRRTLGRSLNIFFTEDLPYAVYQSRRAFQWAFIFFLVAFAVGYFSSAMDEKFANSMLGESYVRMTEENIKKGEPLGVYNSAGHAEMTFGIMFNNIIVCFRYFLAGIFGGIGSVALMMLEGIRLGSFLQFFARRNLFTEANLTVWMHGVLEISAMVIGCAAGMTLGKGLLFPGTLTRIQAFQISARRGTKIFIGTLPMLVLAALIEGNITRVTKIGDGFRAFFIFFWVFVLIFYFIWYPYYKNKKGFKSGEQFEKIPSDGVRPLEVNVLKTSGDIIGDTFGLLRQGRGFIFAVSGILTVIFCSFFFALSKKSPNDTLNLNTSFFQHWLTMGQFFDNENVMYLFLLNAIVLTALHLFLFRYFYTKAFLLAPQPHFLVRRNFVLTLLIQLVFMWLISITGAMIFVYFLTLPYLVMWQYNFRESVDGNALDARQNILNRLKQNFGFVYGTYGVVLLLTYFLYMLSDSLFLQLYLEIISWHLTFLPDSWHTQAATVLTTGVSVFTFYIFYAVNILALISVYYVTGEITDANGLKDRIAGVQKLKNIRGIVKE